MRVIWILINVFFVYTGGQNFNDCVVTPPHDWKGTYTGQRNTTVTGKTCMMWKDSFHPDYGTENYCRTPRQDPASAIGPWCYIDVEPYWEYCFIPTCDEHCVTSDVDKNYRGTLNVTLSGYSCRMWNLNTSLPAGGMLPMFHDEDANYCRSPSGDTETKPWCYTNSFDKRWEHCAVPSCNDIETTICPDLIGYDLYTEPSILTGHRYDSVVTFKCKAGYRVQGSSFLKCLANPHASIYGHWNNPQPTCIQIPGIYCPVLRIHNSNTQMTDRTQHPATLQVICDIGYQLQGDRNIHCGSDGLWSPIPSCVGVQCPFISITNSNVQNIDRKRFPDSIQVTCNRGYQLNGSSNIQCTATGQWNTIPTCVGISCPELVSRAHLSLPTRLSNYTYNDTVRFVCDTGYYVLGDDNIVCSRQGLWNGSVPTCEPVHCPSLNIANANKEIANRRYYYGDHVRLTCDKGFAVKGNTNIACLANGRWDSSLPVCQKIACNTTSVLPNVLAAQSETMVDVNDNVTFFCRPGFSGLTVISTCSIDLTWIPTPPICTSKSEVLSFGVSYTVFGLLAVGIITCSVVAILGVVIYFRRKLKAAESHYESIQMRRGISCPELVSRAHLSLPTRLSNYTYNDTVRFVCDTGYYVLGDDNIVCSRQGLWNGSVPTCEPVHCPSLNIANANKEIANRRYYYGDHVRLTCDKGFAVKGNTNIACLANGRWDSSLPVCQKIACNTTSVLPNVLAAQSETMVDVNDNVTFFCRPGFSGLTVISTCSIDLTWIPTPPICTSKSEVLSFGVSYTVFGLLAVGIITCSVVAILGVVIYFRRKLKAAESHYESIQMRRDFKSRENTDEVYSELT